jgi:phosphoribosylamine--glycine ligase
VNEVTIFHAGTARNEAGALVTAGGRVLDVTATGPTLAVARTRAYEGAGLIAWEGMQFRRDIGAPGSVPERKAGSSAPDAGSAPRR